MTALAVDACRSAATTMGVMPRTACPWHRRAAALPWHASASSRRRHHRVSCSILPPVGGPGTHDSVLSELPTSTERNGTVGRMDFKQLMDEAEQSCMTGSPEIWAAIAGKPDILHINKDRLMALEKLERVERERDLLEARVAQLKAENEASIAECDLLRRKTKQRVSRHQGRSGELMKGLKGSRKTEDPPSMWSDLLLRIDAMTLTGTLQTEQAASLRKLVWARDAQAADVYIKLVDRDDAELAAGLLSMINGARRRGLHIVHICTEMEPVAQCGSTSFHITDLIKALRRKGHLVEVILPKYDCMDFSAVDNLQQVKTDLYINFGDHLNKNRIWTGTVFGIAVTLLESFHPADFFAREEFYNCDDDFERFTYFCKLSLEYLLKLGKQADILHLHNWQTAAVAPLFWEHYAHQGLQDTRLVLTCHDFKNQCLGDSQMLALCGLDPEALNRPDRLQDDFEPGFINLLKGGIVYSNRVTTVSPIYAADVLTEEHGYDLHVALNKQQEKFVGIYNGLDDTLWDPALDSAIPETYSLERMAGKSVCKAKLRQELGLPMVDDSVPLVGCILFESSEVELKLIKAVLNCAVGEAAQFVCAAHNNADQGTRLTDNQIHTGANARVLDAGDDMLHRIVAASDILFCPDIYESTGQSVMIAMRYGAIPVARQVHGVIGSVTGVDEQQRNMSQATGFSFYSTEVSDATMALRNALSFLKRHPQAWSTLIRNCMSKDLSWDASCVEAYEATYWSVLGV